MKFKHSFTGDDALQASFRRLGSAVRRDVAVKALLEAAEPIRADAAARAPRSAGSGPRLADHIIAAETSMSTDAKGLASASLDPGEAAVAIGPAHRPKDLFYGLFQEFGTVHHSAQPFLRPAFDANIRESRRILATALWRAISTALGPTRVQSPGGRTL